MEIEKKNQSKQFISLDNLLEILGNPTRRIILSKIAKVPHSTSEISKILGISRQAIHSQLDILSSNNIIERIGDEKRGGKYRIKSNLSVRIDISPDYYNIKYSMAQIDDDFKSIDLKDIGCSTKFESIESPDDKIRYLGQQIRDIEQNIKNLEGDRRKLLQNKECFIIELKNIINQTYHKNFLKSKSEVENLEREIFYTLFYNPVQFRKRISIDKLIDNLFFSDLDPFTRESKVTNVKSLLKDMSSFMGFLSEDDDDWFFDF
ncbi:MAG TPA: helix-turn-helix domain-containing protein [Candidatus Nanopelagicaceae bacterium]|nr:helix-turn-helix domain-containing protein [Candidatus Nanopelagicaceae bacterium]